MGDVYKIKGTKGTKGTKEGDNWTSSVYTIYKRDVDGVCVWKECVWQGCIWKGCVWHVCVSDRGESDRGSGRGNLAELGLVGCVWWKVSGMECIYPLE